MKINEVEKLLEIPKATIRYYEEKGLIKPARTEATSTGKVYYFTAEWNETQLQFEDDSPVNIIVNGGFEDDFSPSSTEVTFDYREFVSFVRRIIALRRK